MSFSGWEMPRMKKTAAAMPQAKTISEAVSAFQIVALTFC